MADIESKMTHEEAKKLADYSKQKITQIEKVNKDLYKLITNMKKIKQVKSNAKFKDVIANTQDIAENLHDINGGTIEFLTLFADVLNNSDNREYINEFFGKSEHQEESKKSLIKSFLGL